MFIVAIIIGLVSLACWIFVLVKVFQSGNVLMGVLSICPLVAFIYGWVKHKELGIQQVMLVWSVAIVINLILNVVLGPGTTGLTP